MEGGEGSSGATDVKGGALTLLSSRAFRIGIILFAFQQFAGINALVYFSSDVFRQVWVESLHINPPKTP